MIRILILLLMLPTSVQARPATGLLDKTSPLPATIPFQLRAPAGQDYAILLTDPQGDPVISGYLRDGGVLRLLVPPGDHHLNVALGQPQNWQGTADLFGDDSIGLPDPLPFRITGARREGQAVTLMLDEGGLRITDQTERVICQIGEWDNTRVTKTTPLGTDLRWLDPQFSVRSRPCD